jgi:molybdopterin converting factor small subunit
MNVTVYIPSALRDCCRGARELKVSAASVHDALSELAQSHPALYRSVCDETGAVRRHVHIFVNLNLVRGREELQAALTPGDTISIQPAVSGG